MDDPRLDDKLLNGSTRFGEVEVSRALKELSGARVRFEFNLSTNAVTRSGLGAGSV